MQRLFPMFPTARPGVALLLIRTAVAVMMVDGVAKPLLHWGQHDGCSRPRLWLWLCAWEFSRPLLLLCVLLQLVLWASLGETIEIARA